MQNCVICEADDWENLDHLRDTRYWVERDLIDYKNPKIGFKICRTCGYITYDLRRDLEYHYRNNYRSIVGPGNLITCNRKWEYHKAFLGNLIEDPRENSIGYRIIDYGCAYGENLVRLKREYGNRVKGYELTKGFVNYARSSGLDISDGEYDEPYGSVDLIILYHVLEHLPDPLKSLIEFRRSLKPGGKIYLAVPVWLECLEEPSGAETRDFENLFHIDHIQVFTRNSVRNLIIRAGFRIEKYDPQCYGETFLISETEENQDDRINHEDPENNISIIKAQKEAISLYSQGKFEEAIDSYPDYPDAWVALCDTDLMKENEKKIEWLKKGLQACTQESRLLLRLATHYIQWDEDLKKHSTDRPAYSNNIKQAEEISLRMLQIKPGNETALFYLGLINADYKNEAEKAVEYYRKIIEINPSRWGEMQQRIGAVLSRPK